MKNITFLLMLIFALSPMASGQDAENSSASGSESSTLDIVCPSCSAVLYHSSVPALFAGEDFPFTKFIPANPKMPVLTAGINRYSIPPCWKCGQSVWAQPAGNIEIGMHRGQPGTAIFTNEGWKPRRFREGVYWG